MRVGLQAVLNDAGKILLLSTLLAFSYNWISPRGVPFIYSPREIAWAEDDEGNRHPSSEPVAITIVQAKRLFDEGSAIFLDARDEEEYMEGHIEGAHSLPLKLLDERPDVLTSIPKDALIVTYCGGEDCESSRALAFKLAERGYTNIRVFFGGWLAWQQRGFPIDVGPPMTLR